MPTRSRSTSSGGGTAGRGPPPPPTPPRPPRLRRRGRRADAAAPEPPRDVEAAIDLGDRSLYINRELSMLAFQRRVLEEAQDERNPLIERVKFLSILGSNLGEFFMVRVAGLRQQVEAGVADLSADGMTPAEQLVACRELAYQLMREARDDLGSRSSCRSSPRPASHIHDYAELDEGQRAAAVRLLRPQRVPGADAAGLRPRPARSRTSPT